jgi:putative transposase
MSRESPAIEVDASLSSQRVVSVLNGLGSTYGVPKILFVDNGPEFTSKALRLGTSTWRQVRLQPARDAHG